MFSNENYDTKTNKIAWQALDHSRTYSAVNLRFDLPQIAKGFSSKYRPDNCPKQHTKSPKKILHGKAVKMNLIDTRALLRHENEAGTENVTGHRANNILRNAERKLLNEQIRQVNFTIDCLRQETKDRTRGLSKKLPSDVFEKVKNFVNSAQLHQHEVKKERQKNKFMRLKQESGSSTSLDWPTSNTQIITEDKNKWVKKRGLPPGKRVKFRGNTSQITNSGNNNLHRNGNF